MKRTLAHLGVVGVGLATLIGFFLGISAYTFVYAEGASYLSTDPRACANCHIMWPQYDSWQKSSHHHVAGCADCHMPHTFFAKYAAKAENGFNHSWAFTFQNFHEPIQMTRKNRDILQDSCVHCHQTTVHQMLAGQPLTTDTIRCVQCHSTVGHGPRGHTTPAPPPPPTAGRAR